MTAPPTTTNTAHLSALTKVVSNQDAQAIIARFDPQHEGPYPRSRRGLYVVPLNKYAPNTVNKAIDTVYPRVFPASARLWHSTNRETGQVWVGVPGSTPEPHKHNKTWLQRHPKAAPAQNNAAVWNSFAVQKQVEHAQKVAHNTPESRQKMAAEMEKDAADAMPVQIDMTFKQRRIKSTDAAKKDEQPRGPGNIVAPHVKKALEKEAFAKKALQKKALEEEGQK